MKNNTGKGTKKLLLSMAAMAFALVAAATSTYAWFTMNATPAVGEFSVQVSTVQSLEIALDTRIPDGGVESDFKNLSYKGFLNGFEIENWLKSSFDASANQLMLIPSQTGDGKTFTDILGGATRTATRTEAEYGSFENGDLLEKAFFEFTLYFRTADEEGNTIKLDMHNYAGTSGVRTYVENETAGISYSVPSEWLGNAVDRDTLADNDYIVLDPINPNTILAVNVGKYRDSSKNAFINSRGEVFADKADVPSSPLVQGTDENYDEIALLATPIGYASNAMRMSFSPIDSSSLDSIGTRTEQGGGRFIWDPNATEGNFNDDEAAVTRNFAYDMMRAERNDSTLNGAYFQNHIAGDAVGNQTVSTLSVKSDGYRYGAVTIRLWIDGWDAECFNGIMASVAHIALQFKIV